MDGENSLLENWKDLFVYEQVTNCGPQNVLDFIIAVAFVVLKMIDISIISQNRISILYLIFNYFMLIRIIGIGMITLILSIITKCKCIKK